jgi:hypothetical protein
MAEVAGLPEEGPTTLAAVKVQLTLPAAADAQRDPTLQTYVDATNAVVRQLRVASDALTYGDPPPDWPKYVVQGATMLAARLWRRRNSPSGVEAFTDQGAVYVQRNDPDIGILLRIGSYTSPLVG